MIETESTPSGPEQLLPEIEGQQCTYCGRGELQQGKHKGRTGLICTECGVPQVTFS